MTNGSGAPAPVSETDAADRTMVITRVVPAPRDLVFTAWTDPHHVAHWWGPDGFTTTILEMDVRVGGLWRYIMHGPDGTDYDNRTEYVEVVRPERLVYWHGNDVDNDPARFYTVVTFEGEGNQTTVTMNMRFPSVDAFTEAKNYGAAEGGNQTLARLNAYLATEALCPAGSRAEVNRERLELTMSRVFDAPRALVFQMYTDPAHLAEWWGPHGWTTSTVAADITTGGIWHYCMRSAEGHEAWGKSMYEEVVAPERIAYRDFFADADGNAVDGMPQMYIVNEFHEEGGKTRVVARTRFASLAELERIVNMGVEAGMTESWEWLAAAVASQAS